MRIMTWNINRFNGIWNSYYNGDLQQKKRKEYAGKITDKLKEFLVDENDIIVLQEMPYNNEWEQLWKPTIEKKELFTFSNLDIGKKYNYKKLCYTSYSQTIAITTKESNWKSVEKIDELNLTFDLDKNKRPYTNRYVEMYNATINMSLIGVHLNREEEYWKKLAENANKFAVIVGDFNYNSLLKNDNDNRKEKYCEILKTHTQVISEDLITNNQNVSGIDKFFLRNDLFEKSRYSISVLDYCFVRETSQEKQEKLRYSDHNLCICNIECIR